MKPQFFHVADLKTNRLDVLSSQLDHGSDGFFGNIYLVASDGSKFRVAFSCYFGVYEAVIFHFRSRERFNKRCALSFRELLDKVYDVICN